MNARQENIFGMCLRVEMRLDNNMVIVNTLPALVAALTAYKARVTEIRATDIIATITHTGVTEDKQAVRQNLVDACIQQSSILCAFAGSAGNNTLYDEAYKSESDIKHLRDDQLPTYAMLLAERLTDNLASLAGYGVTAATISAFENLTTLYSTASPTPRSVINTRKAANESLKNQFKDISDYLKKVVDKLILTFKTSEPDFVNQYFSDRNIIDQGSGNAELTTIAISGKITNASTTADIPGIAVSLQPVGSSEPPAVVITNATGDYTHTFDEVPIGEEADVTITINTPGFQPVTETFHVVAGQSYPRHYSLTPAP